MDLAGTRYTYFRVKRLQFTLIGGMLQCIQGYKGFYTSDSRIIMYYRPNLPIVVNVQDEELNTIQYEYS